MGKHTAHGYLVEDVYKEAEKFTKLFGFKPARIDETFAGFPMEGKVEFFLWQWKHLEDNLGKEVMAKVKYRDQQAIRCLDIIKMSSLGMTIGIQDIMGEAQLTAATYYKTFETYILAAVFYWILAIVLGVVQKKVEKIISSAYQK